MALAPGGRQPAKVVARYRDGRVVKGHTQSFDPNKPEFRLQLVGTEDTALPDTIAVADLKAVFFVRDFDGNREYNEAKGYEKRPAGRIVEVTFFDGERLVGTSLTYDASRPGFFLFPADPHSNNERVFVVRGATTKVVPLAPGTVPPAEPK
jgi:small nuclear ribonucleoprotein (snRNP)-like protein